MIEDMDDGEVEVSDHVLLQQDESSGNFQGAVDSFFDELLKGARTCTHTHTCNPPGPYAAHTHTCYHTHTRVLGSDEEEEEEEEENRDAERRPPTAKRPAGNREAVRKYREKKKAHTAYLEEEVGKLRALNQQLLRKLQGQAALETEVVRLRSVLVDLRGKIDGELGGFPFQKPCDSTASSRDGDCRVQSQCRTDLPPCPHPPPLVRPSYPNGGKSMATPITCETNCQPQRRAKTNVVVNGNGQPYMVDAGDTVYRSQSTPGQ